MPRRERVADRTEMASAQFAGVSSGVGVSAFGVVDRQHLGLAGRGNCKLSFRIGDGCLTCAMQIGVWCI